MNPNDVRKLFDLNRFRSYQRPAPMILINGLAEQAESWFANRTDWSRHFDVKVPEILVYDGDSLHKRIDEGGEITVDYLTERLAHYLDEYVQRPPYNLVGSSLGGQIVLTYATRHPEKVARLVLICPSGLYGDENLPMMEGVKRSQYDTLVKSVFHRPHFASDELVAAIARKFQDPARDPRALGLAALEPGPSSDVADLGRQRPRDLRRRRIGPRGRPDPEGDPGGDPQLRARSPDREVAAGQQAGHALPPRPSQVDPPDARPGPVPGTKIEGRPAAHEAKIEEPLTPRPGPSLDRRT
jgi:pimeloyl-ACP methyl ester carboxylesterase